MDDSIRSGSLLGVETSALSGATWRSGAHNSRLGGMNTSSGGSTGTNSYLEESQYLSPISSYTPLGVHRPVAKHGVLNGLLGASLDSVPTSPKKGPQRVLTPYGRKMQQEAAKAATRPQPGGQVEPPAAPCLAITAAPTFQSGVSRSVTPAFTVGSVLPLEGEREEGWGGGGYEGPSGGEDNSFTLPAITEDGDVGVGRENVEIDGGDISTSSTLTGSLRSCSPPQVPAFGNVPIPLTSTYAYASRVAAQPRAPASTATATATASASPRTTTTHVPSPSRVNQPQYRVQTLFGKAVVSRVLVKNSGGGGGGGGGGGRFGGAASPPPVPSSFSISSPPPPSSPPLRTRDGNAHTPSPLHFHMNTSHSMSSHISIPIASTPPPPPTSRLGIPRPSPPTTTTTSTSTSSYSSPLPRRVPTSSTASAPFRSPPPVDFEAPPHSYSSYGSSIGATAGRLPPTPPYAHQSQRLLEEGGTPAFSSPLARKSGTRVGASPTTTTTTSAAAAGGGGGGVEKYVRYRPQGSADPVKRWAEMEGRQQQQQRAHSVATPSPVQNTRARPSAAMTPEGRREEPATATATDTLASSIMTLLASHGITLDQVEADHPLWPIVKSFLGSKGLAGVDAITKAAGRQAMAARALPARVQRYRR